MSFKLKFSLTKILFFLLFSFLLSSCKERIKDAIKQRLENQGDETISESTFKRIEVDSLYALSLPKYMNTMDNLNEQATLQYGNVYKNSYTTVTHEDIQDFVVYYKEVGAYIDSLSVIENYTNAQLSYFNRSIKNCEIYFHNDSKISNYEARQYKFTGTIANQEVVYLMAYIETEGDLFLIMNWTSDDRFLRFKETFETINSSFEYIINTTVQDEIQ